MCTTIMGANLEKVSRIADKCFDGILRESKQEGQYHSQFKLYTHLQLPDKGTRQ